MNKRSFFVLASLAGAALVLLTILLTGAAAFKGRHSEAFKSWNREAIKATYMARQLKESDKTHSN